MYYSDNRNYCRLGGSSSAHSGNQFVGRLNYNILRSLSLYEYFAAPCQSGSRFVRIDFIMYNNSRFNLFKLS